MLFDTTFFIDLEEELKIAGTGGCSDFLQAHRHQTKHVSVVTMGEFAVGSSATAAVRFFRGYQRIVLGRDLAVFGGRLQALLPFEMGQNDLWIAASAMYHNLPLVSRDRDFRRIPGLKILDY